MYGRRLDEFEAHELVYLGNDRRVLAPRSHIDIHGMNNTLYNRVHSTLGQQLQAAVERHQHTRSSPNARRGLDDADDLGCLQPQDNWRYGYSAGVEMSAGEVTYGSAVSQDECFKACSAEPECKQAVYYKTDSLCYPMNAANARDTVGGTNTEYVSVLCNSPRSTSMMDLFPVTQLMLELSVDASTHLDFKLDSELLVEVDLLKEAMKAFRKTVPKSWVIGIPLTLGKLPCHSFQSPHPERILRCS